MDKLSLQLFSAAGLPPEKNKFITLAFVENTSNSVTITKPAEVMEGDLLLFIGGRDTNYVYNIASGWTLIRTLTYTYGGLSAAVYYKIATASEPASYTFSGTGFGYSGTAAILVIRSSGGYDVSALPEATAGSYNGFTAYSLTPTVDGKVLVLYIINGAAITTPPSGVQEFFAPIGTQVSGKVLLYGYYMDGSASISTTIKTCSTTDYTYGISLQVALKD